MQSVKQATEIVAYVTGTPASRASQIARTLIDAEILPKSAGRAIKAIDAVQLLPLVAAVAMAEKISDAPKVARAFQSLLLNGETVDEGEPPQGFADWFARVMQPDGVWRKAAKVEFSKTVNGYTAEISGTMSNEAFDAAIVLPFWSARNWGHFCKTSFTISAEGILVLRNLFDRDDIEGMSFGRR